MTDTVPKHRCGSPLDKIYAVEESATAYYDLKNGKFEEEYVSDGIREFHTSYHCGYCGDPLSDEETRWFALVCPEIEEALDLDLEEDAEATDS